MISLLGTLGMKDVKPEEIPNIMVAMKLIQLGSKYLTADKVGDFRAAITNAEVPIEGVETLYAEIEQMAKSDIYSDMIPALLISKAKGDPDYDKAVQAFNEWSSRMFDIKDKYRNDITTASNMVDQIFNKIVAYMETRTAVAGNTL
jgi:hypothetical protein